MAYTGGKLNILNGKYGISAPQNSVPIMKLIRIHNPKSPKELQALIEQHHMSNCECGIKSKGTVEDFGKNLYEVQKKEWGEFLYSLEECIEWEYNLFIINSLLGNKMEQKAIESLKTIMKEYIFLESNSAEDEEFRVDIVVKLNDKIVAGIQVKPKTYTYIRQNVIYFNQKANEKFPVKVNYLYYDDNFDFINTDEVMSGIKFSHD